MPLLGWWLYGLFDVDEGFYGAVVAEMNRRGEWITPYYNGHPWFEKPILLYWMAKPMMLAFGDVVGPRLPSVLATLGTYALIAWFVRRRWDDQAARWCVAIAGSSLLIVAVGRMMMTDALLNFCLVGAFVTFWESLEGNPRWRLLSAFFLGLSVLAKGPVGLILFTPVAAWTFWRERDLRKRFAGWWLLGIAILAVTIATWYVPAHLANGQEFVQKFLIEQNLNRFTGGDPAHTLPFLTGLLVYPLVLLVALAPWSWYLPKAWPRGYDPAKRYLVVWAAVPFIFFMVSKAKLPHYILPCAVPITILVGVYLSNRASETGRRLPKGPMLACLVVALIANFGFIIYYNLFHAEVHALTRYVRDNAAPNDDVDSYQMGRREKSLGTGKLKIQETSHPSLVMILNRIVREPETVQELLDDPKGQWIITRWNRIQDSDKEAIHATGRELQPVDTGISQDLYRLYFLTPTPAPRTRR